MGFRLRAALAISLLLPAGLEARAASDPAGDQVIQQMRAVLEPDRPSLRIMDMTVQGDGESTTFRLAQARKTLPDGRRSLTVLLAPPAARGLAYLVVEKKGSPEPIEYTYVPVVRRVRKLVGAENQTAFLDSDFTYADLGFLPLDTQNRLVGEEKLGDRDVYKVESVPAAEIEKWYVSKIATWVDKQTLLPVQRDFYSPNGEVFKIETFDNVNRVDGVPTPFQITMQNVGADTKSVLKVTEVTYGSGLPDNLFEPKELPQIADVLEKTGSINPK